MKWKAETLASGSTFTEISGLTLGKVQIKIPSIGEQILIGEIFKKIDNLISLHQRKLDKLKELKKAYLSKLFPAEGQRKPELRFKGFTDDWEQRKLYEIADFNPKSDLPDEFEYVDLESVVGTEMIYHRTVKRDSAPSRAQRLAKNGDIFYQTVRPYQRNNYLYTLSDNGYVFSTGYAQIRPQINSRFLISLLQTDQFVSRVLENCTGTSYPAINSQDLSNLNISLPLVKMEQEKIGITISNLASLITLHQRNKSPPNHYFNLTIRSCNDDNLINNQCGRGGNCD